jgi:hypothetical protein
MLLRLLVIAASALAGAAGSWLLRGRVNPSLESGMYPPGLPPYRRHSRRRHPPVVDAAGDGQPAGE